LSARAAWRLESLGFTKVFDYTDGKVDWMAAGLPTKGSNANLPRAGEVARGDVPTCGLEERIRDVKKRVSAQNWDACVVVNDERVVLGLLRDEDLAKDDDKTAEQVMRGGPRTVRPYVSIEEMAQNMTDHDLHAVLVSTSDGRLVGLLRIEEAKRSAQEQHAHHANDEASA
jgi:CBS domain-containing protein